MDEIKELVKDKFLMDQCTEMTGLLLKGGLPINRIVEVVKDYQRKYILIKKESVHMARQFTIVKWWECQNKI